MTSEAITTGLVWDERYAWHDAGWASTSVWAEPYPALDRPEAKRRLWALLQASGLADRLTLGRARSASDAELLRFHTADYVDRVIAWGRAARLFGFPEPEGRPGSCSTYDAALRRFGAWHAASPARTAPSPPPTWTSSSSPAQLSGNPSS